MEGLEDQAQPALAAQPGRRGCFVGNCAAELSRTRGEPVRIYKNNTDFRGHSYGCHENYLVGRHGEFSRLADVLIPFLVSRQIIVGAGKVLQTPRGAVYCVSQRAEHIWEGVSSATTRSRPIINTRDEPHADAERYRRLHVIVGDSNMSETTTMLKVGAVDLVLRMVEAGAPLRDLSLENPIRAIREISHDTTGRRRVRLANGREASALDEMARLYEGPAARAGEEAEHQPFHGEAGARLLLMPAWLPGRYLGVKVATVHPGNAALGLPTVQGVVVVTLFIVVFGTIGGHLLGTGFFAIQAAWCRATAFCYNPGFDPNIYRAFLRGAAGARPAGRHRRRRPFSAPGLQPVARPARWRRSPRSTRPWRARWR